MIIFYQQYSIDKYYRFLQFDFTNIDDLKSLVLLYENQFETICFDWSVWKFFVHCSMTIENCIERLNCFYKLLKPNGVLIIPEVFSMSMFVLPPGRTPFNTSKEEIAKIKHDAQNEHFDFIMKILNKSNFFGKFTTINSKSVKNELFLISTNLHEAYQNDQYTSNGYDVLLAIK